MKVIIVVGEHERSAVTRCEACILETARAFKVAPPQLLEILATRQAIRAANAEQWLLTPREYQEHPPTEAEIK